MKRFGALIVALSLLVSAGTASAEEEPWDHDYFLERSYFVVYPLFLLGGEKTLPIIVEGDSNAFVNLTMSHKFAKIYSGHGSRIISSRV